VIRLSKDLADFDKSDMKKIDVKARNQEEQFTSHRKGKTTELGKKLIKSSLLSIVAQD